MFRFIRKGKDKSKVFEKTLSPEYNIAFLKIIEINQKHEYREEREKVRKVSRVGPSL